MQRGRRRSVVRASVASAAVGTILLQARTTADTESSTLHGQCCDGYVYASNNFTAAEFGQNKITFLFVILTPRQTEKCDISNDNTRDMFDFSSIMTAGHAFGNRQQASNLHNGK